MIKRLYNPVLNSLFDYIYTFEKKIEPKEDNNNNNDNTTLVERFIKDGGQLMHFPPNGNKKQGLTLAYRHRNNLIEIATAVQNKQDVFVKKIGAKLAIERFNNNETIFIPTYHKDPFNVSEALKGFFNYYI